jgi:hypothetical protein
VSFRQKHENGNRAVAMLAACFVVLGGAGTCAVIVLSAGLEHADTAILSIAGVTAAMLALMWLLCVRPPENRMKTAWSWLSGRRKRRVPYHLRAKLPASERVSSPPAPPTVETIRAITGRQGTWVPAPQQSPQDSSGGGS